MGFRSFAMAVVALLPLSAVAQGQAPVEGQAEMLKTLALAGRNQLGVLEFCRAQGSVGTDVVDLQRKALGLLPPVQVDGLADAEALGKRGVVSVAGSQTELAVAAKSRGTTVDAMCKKMADLLQSQAASLPK